METKDQDKSSLTKEEERHENTTLSHDAEEKGECRSGVYLQGLYYVSPSTGTRNSCTRVDETPSSRAFSRFLIDRCGQGMKVHYKSQSSWYYVLFPEFPPKAGLRSNLLRNVDFL